MIEHFADPESLLAEAAERLPEHGRLILTTPIRLLERSLDAHHVHEFWSGELQALLGKYFADIRLIRMHPVWFADLICFGINGVRSMALLANLLRLCTGIEIIDKLGSPLSIFWTQAVVATGPRRAGDQ